MSRFYLILFFSKIYLIVVSENWQFTVELADMDFLNHSDQAVLKLMHNFVPLYISPTLQIIRIEIIIEMYATRGENISWGHYDPLVSKYYRNIHRQDFLITQWEAHE